MWGGSNVPPSRPLRTPPRIGTEEVATDPRGPAGSDGGAAGRRQQIETARISSRANEMREGIGVLTIHPNREMQLGPGMSKPRPPHHLPGRDPSSDLHEDCGKKRDRRLETTPMVDRHRQHPGDAARKRHHPIPARPDPAS